MEGPIIQREKNLPKQKDQTDHQQHIINQDTPESRQIHPPSNRNQYENRTRKRHGSVPGLLEEFITPQERQALQFDPYSLTQAQQQPFSLQQFHLPTTGYQSQTQPHRPTDFRPQQQMKRPRLSSTAFNLPTFIEEDNYFFSDYQQNVSPFPYSRLPPPQHTTPQAYQSRMIGFPNQSQDFTQQYGDQLSDLKEPHSEPDLQSQGTDNHISKSSAFAPPKKGSVISPEDRRPPTASELQFYEANITILQGLMAYNMQYLTFFPQKDWLPQFKLALSKRFQTFKSTSSLTQLLPKTQQSGVKAEHGPSIAATELRATGNQQHSMLQDQLVHQTQFFEDLLLEPDNEMEPFVNLTYSNFPTMNPSLATSTSEATRRRSSIRLLSKTGNRSHSLSPRVNLNQVPILNLEEVFLPQLSSQMVSEISSLTIFQKSLARFKCREVFGLYGLLLKHRTVSKLVNAQLMENNSRFVVRTILNWGREYQENGGRFNRSRIGKHKRVTLFSNNAFREALLSFAEEKGSSISVDNASAFIKEYHKKTLAADPSSELPTPPSSRATVHRWLKLLNIKLGPRGKKKGSKSKKQ